MLLRCLIIIYILAILTLLSWQISSSPQYIKSSVATSEPPEYLAFIHVLNFCCTVTLLICQGRMCEAGERVHSKMP